MKTNISIIPNGQPAAISASQYDTARKIIVNIVDESNNPCMLSDDMTATIQGTKPSGLGFTAQGVISGSQIEFTTTAEMTDEPGYIPAEIVIEEDAGKVTTANCVLIVEASTHPDGTTDGIAEHLVSEITVLVGRAETASANAASAAIRAEDAAQRAEEAAEHGGGGISPTAKVIKVGDTATITITDKDGTTTASISDGKDGIDGAPGKDGKDGIDGAPGKDGIDGKDGSDGSDGFSPTVTAERSGGVVNVTITDITGTHVTTIADGVDGKDGVDGHTPVKGTDYWTAQDKADIVTDVLAEMIDAETEGM